MTHGTLTSYTSGRCRCPVCRERWNEYRRLYWHAVKAGPLTVEAEPVVEYIGLLLRHGHSYTSISTATGIARSTIGRIHAGHRERVRRVNADAIMGVRLTEPVPGHKVPVSAILPAIDAAREHGATMQDICRAAGVAHKYVPRDGKIGWDKFARIVCVLRIAVRDRVLPATVLEGVQA